MLHKILSPWEALVHSYKWSPPLHPEAVFALGGYPPSFWKTTTLRKLDTAVLDSLGKVRRQLHGRNGHTYALSSALTSFVVKHRDSKGKSARSFFYFYFLFLNRNRVSYRNTSTNPSALHHRQDTA